MAEAAEPRILVVHPDAGLRGRVAAILGARGHNVAVAPQLDSIDASPDVLVIDHRALPGSTSARVLALVPDRVEATILAAFTAGADDVLTGPLGALELTSRVASLAGWAIDSPPARIGPIAIDRASRRVTLCGLPLELTRREYELLARLAAAPGRVVTKAELLRDVWEVPPTGRTRRLDTQVARLRRRLGEHRALLVTVWGVGYRLG